MARSQIIAHRTPHELAAMHSTFAAELKLRRLSSLGRWPAAKLNDVRFRLVDRCHNQAERSIVIFRYDVRVELRGATAAPVGTGLAR